MTKALLPCDASQFLYSMRRRSFAFVGAAMLLRAHLELAPGNRLSRTAVHILFQPKSANTLMLLEEVMDFAFREDADGLIYLPALDRAAATA